MTNICALTLSDEVALCVAELQAQQPLSDLVMESGRNHWQPGSLAHDKYADRDVMDGNCDGD